MGNRCCGRAQALATSRSRRGRFANRCADARRAREGRLHYFAQMPRTTSETVAEKEFYRKRISRAARVDVKPKHTLVLVLACAWGLGPLPPAGSGAAPWRGQRPAIAQKKFGSVSRQRIGCHRNQQPEMKKCTTEMKKISPAPTDLVSHKREQDTVGSRRSSQTLLLRRKYVLWRCALVYERLRCEPWRPSKDGGFTPEPVGRGRASFRLCSTL